MKRPFAWSTAITVAVVIGLAGSMLAQSSTLESTRYQVVYVSVGPSSVAAFRNSVDQYRETSRGELGFVGYELFEQLGRPGEFVMIETWRDQAAAEAHGTAASRKSFLVALDPLRVSGYDERPYKTFAVGPGQGTASAASVLVVTHVDVAPPGDPTPLLRQLVADSRAEPGCLGFDVLQHAARANHFTIVEAWRDQQARDVHAAAAHTRRYRDALQPLIGSPLDERLMKRH
jgi:quinol monooxygenase YgiN